MSVQRFGLFWSADKERNGVMEEFDHGNWVQASDYDALTARVAELEKAAEAMLDTEGCGCCASEGHSENKLRLRELLKQPHADGAKHE